MLQENFSTLKEWRASRYLALRKSKYLVNLFWRHFCSPGVPFLAIKTVADQDRKHNKYFSGYAYFISKIGAGSWLLEKWIYGSSTNGMFLIWCYKNIFLHLRHEQQEPFPVPTWWFRYTQKCQRPTWLRVSQQKGEFLRLQFANSFFGGSCTLRCFTTSSVLVSGSTELRIGLYSETPNGLKKQVVKKR